jgi:endonuclease YncB( thermonuclease family)
MPMLLIRGEYQALNAQPDGDSVRFYPTSVARWGDVPGTSDVQPNASGGAQLRLDGIDALETHYPVSGLGVVHQPDQFGDEASETALAWLGFTQITRAPSGTVTASTPVRKPGFILTRTADRNGRCVAFAFRGETAHADGALVHFDIPLLHASLNYHLLTLGLVYPTYYTKLYYDIRGEMTKAAKQARASGAGLWPADLTRAGFGLLTIQDLFTNVVCLPKLFRRLIDYLALNDGDPSVAGFPAYLAARDDRLIVLPTGQVTGFDSVVRLQSGKVKIIKPIENLVFVEA